MDRYATRRPVHPARHRPAVPITAEHGAGELTDAVAMLRATESSGTPCMVRAPWNDPIWIKRVLDAGAESLMIPQIETAAAARAAVAACRYPPQGMRGAAGGTLCVRP